LCNLCCLKSRYACCRLNVRIHCEIITEESQAESCVVDPKSSRRAHWQWRCFECSQWFDDYNVYKLHAREHSFKSTQCSLCQQPLYTVENPDIHTCGAAPSSRTTRRVGTPLCVLHSVKLLARTIIQSKLIITRKPCCRKDNRAMHPMYG